MSSGTIFDLINTGITRFVEFETANDLKTAVEKLDGREFKGSRVSCIADVRTSPCPRNRTKSSSSLRSKRTMIASPVIPTGLGHHAGATPP